MMTLPTRVAGEAYPSLAGFEVPQMIRPGPTASHAVRALWRGVFASPPCSGTAGKSVFPSAPRPLPDLIKADRFAAAPHEPAVIHGQTEGVPGTLSGPGDPPARRPGCRNSEIAALWAQRHFGRGPTGMALHRMDGSVA